MNNNKLLNPTALTAAEGCGKKQAAKVTGAFLCKYLKGGSQCWAAAARQYGQPGPTTYERIGGGRVPAYLPNDYACLKDILTEEPQQDMGEDGQAVELS
ncbi:MAG TPA: hypothetical protein VGG13_01080 [Candidatus Saccharimonadales bacterium]|jgi:hypothetical protein